MLTKEQKRIKYGCYATNLSMAIIGTLSSLLFVTFNTEFGISFSLLGFLVLVTFCTQLLIDLLFTAYSHKFNIEKVVKSTPYIVMIGMLAYTALPFLFPNYAYAGLLVGTVIFSSAGGLIEVLISPIIAALPSEHPDRELSKLHSIYAWGVVLVVLISTLFFVLFSTSNWYFLVIFFAILPIVAAVLFFGCKLPKLGEVEKISGIKPLLKNKTLWLGVLAIFLGASSECSMAQWSSSYLEQALQIPKTFGDLFGVAFFAIMLGLGRTLYGKYGKNIRPVLLLGSLSATICYLVVVFSGNAIVGLIACGLTGLSVSMLWPGNLILMNEHFPKAGVALFALMAAGGDLGASVGPQLMGVLTDFALTNETLISTATNMGLTSAEFSMRFGMFFLSLFPLIGTVIFVILNKKPVNKN